jgi:hypothetical protein
MPIRASHRAPTRSSKDVFGSTGGSTGGMAGVSDGAAQPTGGADGAAGATGAAPAGAGWQLKLPQIGFKLVDVASVRLCHSLSPAACAG